MFIYQKGIQIYDQISIVRNWLEVKPCHAFLLELSSKGSQQLETLQKLAYTFLYQTGIQIYDQISIVRNQSEGKLRRSFSLELGSKGSKWLGPLQKLACMFLYQMGIQIYDQISIKRNRSKVKPFNAIFARVGFKRGLNCSKHGRSCSACLSTKSSSKSMIKF